MRSIHWLALPVGAISLLVCGCGSGNDDGNRPIAFQYTTGTAVYVKGTPITPNTPASSPAGAGSSVITYSVSPTLPNGLSLSTSTGIISGTPTAVTAEASYTVTASNSNGIATAALTITVMNQPPSAQFLPNLGQQITPLAPEESRFEPLTPGLTDNPGWQAGQAVSTVVSPDHKTLLILTSGYNRVYTAAGTPFDWADSKEYVFIYDISQGSPVKKQVVTIPNSYHGIVFDPSSKAFYVASGMGDFPYDSAGRFDPLNSALDNVHIFVLSADGTAWGEQKPELALGHQAGLGLAVANAGPVPINSSIFVYPCAAGVAISKDGKTLVAANYFNDSITVFTGGLGSWSAGTEIDLRPGKSILLPKPGVPGGEYPFWVALTGSGPSAKAYVSSIRDREIDVVDLSGTPWTTVRIPVKGQPNKMTLNTAQSLLYVAEDQSDTVDVIDTAKNVVVETIPVVAPPAVLQSYPLVQKYLGANSNSVTLSPDETQLYVTNGNLNSIAVVALGGTNSGDQVVGLIPTGWYPNSVSFSGDGKWVYAVNGKSPTGPNAGLCYSSAPALGSGQPGAHKNCFPSGQYNPQLTKAGFQSFPRPTMAQLPALTEQTATNNRFASTESASDAAVMAAVRKGIQHVVFIIKENRSYDQVLGDLEVGNGDPDLTEFGEALTPNLHNLARGFVTLDNFMDSAEVSYDGWLWTTSARAPDIVEHQFPVAYAGRGLSLDSEGNNRSVNVSIPTAAGRRAADSLTPDDDDLLPGQADVGAPDGPNNELNTGYLWDSALRANLTVRNYGFFLDFTLYPNTPPPGSNATPIPLTPMPALADPPVTVAIPTNVALTPYTDPYYRGFDNQFPDYYRFKEWEREFDVNYAKAGLPALSLVRLMHDHTGNFDDPGKFLLNTPELQQADNDYAVGLLVQKIANSIYANNTLIFVIEDDSQDAGDHVDSHRSVAFVAGAYVRRGAVVSSQYNTINFVRTIEEVLGLPPMNLNDALARPMADVFNTQPSSWSFTATIPASLYGANLPINKPSGLTAPASTHTGEYWTQATKGVDFTTEDRMNFADYNRILWDGLMGNKPHPGAPSGMDLSQNRKELRARAELLSQALLSFPASTKSLEYDNLAQLRKSPSYGVLRRQYTGASLERVKAVFSQLGIAEDSMQEVVTAAGSTGFYGLVSGTFSGIGVGKRPAQTGLSPRLIGNEQARCAGSEVCVIFLQDSLAAFGEAAELQAMIDARQGSSRRLGANTPIAQLLAKADLHAPVIGVAPGSGLASWIGDSVASRLLSPANLLKALDNISLFQYSVQLDATAHLNLTLACGSPLAAVSVREVLSALNVVNSLSGGDATSSFDHLTVGSNEKLVHLTMDTKIR